MLSPAVTPRAQRRSKEPCTPDSGKQEKENACHRASRSLSRALRSAPLSPRVTNHTRSPLPELKHRLLQDSRKRLDDDPAQDGRPAQQECVLEMSPRRRVDSACTAEGKPRKQALILLHETDGSIKESRKRRFEDIATPSPVSKARDTNQTKRFHKKPTPPARTPVSARNKARPNPFDHPLSGITSKNDNARPNPFDYPLHLPKTSAAPIKSYKRSSQTRRLVRSGDSVNNDPPIRELISYADLWEGVSSIDQDEFSVCTAASNGMFDASAPMYDFLYDGIWKRRSGRSVVCVGKRRRVFWRGDCWYGGWCRIGKCARRKGGYHDLDCPHLEGLIVCGD